MNRASIIALVIGAMLFGCGAGMVAHEVWESDAIAYEGQAWEYTVVYVGYPGSQKIIETCDTYGAEGWELVTVEKGQAYFKAPLSGQPKSIDFDYEDE